MLRLLKYELRKTLFAKLVVLAITVIAEAVFLVGFESNNERTLVIGAGLLTAVATVGIALMGILSLVTLHRDMNTRQGYMLFMTPNSCYRILGAKVIECALSLLLAGAFFFGLAMLDFNILFGNDTFRFVWEFFTEMMRAINDKISLTAPTLIALAFCLLASWLCTITTAYLADVISSSLLNGKKGNLLITFLFFLLLNYGVNRVVSLVDTADIVMTLVWQGVIALGLAGIMYVITARLMEKYLSV